MAKNSVGTTATASKATTARGGDSRRQELLEAAARRFAKRGYEGTSIRDIARDVGMLPGSIYYHFRSKEELLVAVHEQGVHQVMEAVRNAVTAAGDDPWDRLTAAAEAHLESLLGENAFSPVVTPQFTRSFEDPLRATLIAQRDSYEAYIVSLVRALPLPAGASRQLFRLSLLGSLNWTLTWYRPGGKKPATLARRMLDLYRRQLDENYE